MKTIRQTKKVTGIIDSTFITSKCSSANLSVRTMITLLFFLFILIPTVNSQNSKREREKDKTKMSKSEAREEMEREKEESEKERDGAQQALERDVKMMKDQALGYVPGERILIAKDYKDQLMHQRTAIANVNWYEQGPNNLGGRTRTLMIDPNDASGNTVWAGSVGGGLWKTTDITNASPNWQPVDDLLNNLAVTSITYDPTNPMTMYFSTGEGYGNQDAIRGLGVWKSADGGVTWAQLPSTNTSNFYFCQKVTVGTTGVVFVATSTGGLQRSANGGATFTKVLGSGLGITGAASNYCYDVEVAVNGDIYASIDGSVHKSTTAGATFGAAQTLGITAGRVELACAPNDANYVYALVENGNAVNGILRTINGGTTWTTRTEPDDADSGIPATDFSRGQAWYDLSIAVDPLNKDRLFVGGVDIFVSTDGAGTWNQVAHWYGGFGLQYAHADQHNIVFKNGSSSIAYFCNDGGVFRTSNANVAVPTLVDKNLGYRTAQFYACALHPTAQTSYCLAGAQDNGTHKFIQSGIQSTTEPTGGDGAFCHIDQNQPQFQFASYVYNDFYRSIDGGNTWTNITTSGGDFISPTDYDDVNNRLYMCNTAGTYKRWDDPQTGATFVASPTITAFNSGNVTSVKVSPNTANRVFFGMDNGRVVRVDNANTATPTSTNISTSLPPGYVSCVEVETGNDNHLLVTYSNYGVPSVWESTNAGASWISQEGNLPDMPIRWALFNPNNNDQVLLATELGVWSTDNLNGGATNWGATNSGLANVRVDMLQLRQSDKYVIAATHGRGLFASDLFTAPTSIFSSNIQVTYLNVPVQFTSTSYQATDWSWDFGDGSALSTLENPVHTYTTAGRFNVTLTVNSGVSTLIRTDYIHILPNKGTPYVISNGGGFEVNVDDFDADNFTGTHWERGNSSVSGKNGVHGGSNAWVTGLVGNYVINSDARLMTPNYNLTAAGTYTLSFWTKYSTENQYDGFRVQYTLDKGTTWTQLGVVASGWYNFANASGSTAFPIGEPFFTGSQASYANKTRDISFLSGNASVAFRIQFKSDYTVIAVGVAIDDFEILGPTNTAIGVASIVNVGTLSSFTSCNGVASTQQTFTTSGTGLTANLVVTAPTGFEVSTTSGSGFSGSVSLTPSSGTVATTTIFVRMAASASGTPSGNISCTSTGATTQNVAVSGIVNPTNTVGAASSTPTLCINTAFSNITHATTGATGIGTATGLPSGVSAGFASNTITLSGTPTASGTFNYSIPLTGGCGVANAVGTITVSPLNTVSVASSTPTLCINTTLVNITHTTTGATGIGTSTGLPFIVFASFASNTITISGIPTTSGTYNYSIPLTGGCGAVNATGTIIVTPNKTVSAASSTPTLCINTPLTNITHTTTGATGIGTATGLPSGVSAGFASNTITISGTPTASGTFAYTIPLTGGCGVANATGTITVNPLPIAGITNNTGTLILTCSTPSISLTATGGGTYLWDDNSTSAARTVTTSGTYSVTVTSGGCSSTASVIITQNITPPTAVITGSLTFCSGGSTTLDLGAGFIGYSWSTGANTQTIVVTTATTITGTVTAANGCTASTAVTTTVNTTLSPTITGTLSFCAGSSTVLDLGAGYTTYSWSNGATSQTIVVTTATTLTGTVTLGGCSGTSPAVTTTVNPIPTAPMVVSSGDVLCAGGADTLISSASSGNQWMMNGNPISGATSQMYIASVAGVYTDMVTVLGCTSSASNSITVSIAPNVTITASAGAGGSIAPSGVTTVCSLSNATTYTITANSGFTILDVMVNSVSVGAVATYTFTNVNTNQTIDASFQVAAGCTQPVGNASDIILCSGNTTNILLNSTLAGTTFAWTSSVTTGSVVGNSFCSSGCANTISETLTDVGSGNGVVTYVVVPTAAGCTGAPFTVTASLVVVPPAPVIAGPNVVCGLTTATYTATTLGVPSYTWAVPTGLIITSGQGTSTITCTVSAGSLSGNVTCNATNTCGTSTTTSYMVTKKPFAPGVINGPTSTCAQSTASWNVTPVFGATGYSWTVPTGMTIVSGVGTTSITVTIASTFIYGQVKVNALNACGNVAGPSLTVYGNVPAVPLYLNGSANVCGLTSTSYNVSTTASSGATGYFWTVPSWMTITSGQFTSMIAVSITGAPVAGNTITVSGTNVCGTGTAKVLSISTSAVQPASITGPTNTCSLTSATYQCSSVAGGVSYQWTPAIGQTIISGQGTTMLTVSILATTSATTANSYLKVVSVNACGVSSAIKQIVITRCLSPDAMGNGVEEEGEISIHPNPATTELRIAYLGLRIGVVEMYDILGNRVLQSEITNPQSEINVDISALAKGIYFVRIVSEGTQVFSQRIIKE